jgi:hypothetical protein
MNIEAVGSSEIFTYTNIHGVMSQKTVISVLILNSLYMLLCSVHKYTTHMKVPTPTYIYFPHSSFLRQRIWNQIKTELYALLLDYARFRISIWVNIHVVRSRRLVPTFTNMPSPRSGQNTETLESVLVHNVEKYCLLGCQRAVRQKHIDVSEYHTASIFSVKEEVDQGTNKN